MNRFHEKSPCPHRPLCPGCGLIELPYAAQISRKHSELAETLKDFRECLKPFVTARRPLNYRNRAKVIVKSKGRWGIYQRNSHKLVAIPKCLVHMDHINEIAQQVAWE